VLLNGFAGLKKRDARLGTSNKAETDRLDDAMVLDPLAEPLPAVDAPYAVLHKVPNTRDGPVLVTNGLRLPRKNSRHRCCKRMGEEKGTP
jgi:hypothetical protein